MSEQSVVVLGLGLSGWSSVRYLHSRYDVQVMDDRIDPPNFEEAVTLLGKDAVIVGRFDLAQCLEAAFIVVSPGISIFSPIIVALQQAGKRLVTDVELFLEVAAAPVIGITGTNGKSTMTDLLAHVASEQGVRVAAGGNLGRACLDMLDPSVELYILELSSFQLAYGQPLSLDIAVLLNLDVDHCDWHGSMAHYHDSKRRIIAASKMALLAGQCLDETADNNAIYGDFQAKKMICRWQMIGHEFTWYGDKDRQQTLDLESVTVFLDPAILAIIFSICSQKRWPLLAVCNALSSYRGLPHRGQVVATYDGVLWINDSKATNGHAVVFALAQLQVRYWGRLILILAGQPKGWDNASINNFNGLFKNIIIVGDCADLFVSVFADMDVKSLCETVADAVERARALAKSGDCVLFSPGGASFDQYANFTERGNDFQAKVMMLKE